MDFELKVKLDIVVATVVGKTQIWGWWIFSCMIIKSPYVHGCWRMKNNRSCASLGDKTRTAKEGKIMYERNKYWGFLPTDTKHYLSRIMEISI
jgi:hypothetical protein